MKLSNRVLLLQRQRAPDHLRHRVITALRLEARDPGLGSPQPTAATNSAFRIPWHRAAWALLAAAASVILLVTQRDTPGLDAVQSAATALVELQTVAEISSTEASHVRSWLEARVGYPVDVPSISDAVLNGGRVLDANGSTLAAITFRLHGKPLTYLAMPTAEVLGHLIEHEYIETMSLDSYNVATWIERGTARVVIAPMPKRHVAAVARECRRKASAS